MDINPEKVATDFLELASEQRLSILQNLAVKNLNISKLAKLLEATSPEVHRNIGRLVKNGLIMKNPDANYELTTYGKVVLAQIPSISFLSDNMEFFNAHTLSGIKPKFIQRIGSLESKKRIKGFVKVLEKWQKIQENAGEYIYNILSEVPYSREVIEVVLKKLEDGITIKTIFSQNTVIPENRKKMFEEMGFQKYVTDGVLERKISDNVFLGVLITEKEAAVFFQKKDGELDLSEMFVSSEKDFGDWCRDYFEEQWKDATSFQESKLKKDSS